METRAHHVLIGLVTVLVVVAGMLFGLWLAKSSVDSEFKDYEIVFNEAVTGLSKGGMVERWMALHKGRWPLLQRHGSVDRHHQFLGDQRIEGHQQVQVEAAEGRVVDIGHVDIIDQVNRFEASHRAH